MTKRVHAVTNGVMALFLASGGLVLTASGTAHADITGTATLTPTSGATTDKPAFTELTLSAGCPTGYQTGARVDVVLPSGALGTLLITNIGAPYGSGPVTIDFPSTAPTGSAYIPVSTVVTSQHLADGTYPLSVECGITSPTTDQALRTYTNLNLEVAGASWTVKEVAPPTETTLALTESPKGHGVVDQDITLTAAVTPADAAGTVTFTQTGTALVLGSAAVSNGSASATMTPVANPTLRGITAVFVPDDATKYAQSTATDTYPIVASPAITVLDDTGNNLQDTPTLKGGQKLAITAEGFQPNTADATAGEDVDIALDGTAATPASASATVDGTVDNLAYTVPSDIADGTHRLSLTGKTSGVEIDFPFITGSSTSADDGGTSGDSSGSTAGDSGDSSGTTAGDSGDSSGATAGDSGDSSGATAGAVDDSSAGSTGTADSGSGSSGVLAATGAAGVLPLGGLGLVLIAVGGYAVYRVRRDGRMLTFGSTPRD